jgi:colicin import membrane protein
MTEFSPNTHPALPMGSFALSAQWRSMTLAAMVHGLLLAFLWVGVRWQSQETAAVEAEVWDMTARQAAPKPVPVETISPEPENVVVKVLPKEEPVEDPEIVLMQEKKRKLKEKKKQEEVLKLERQKQLDAELKAELKKEKLAEQKKKTDEADAKKKLLTKEQSVRDKVFAENMRRLAGQAGSGGTGDAAKSSGNNRGDPSYAARIAAKVRSNTVFNASDTSSNNPTVEYRIDLLPDGSLRGMIRKLKSSGVPAFDDAVEKAIEKSLPFPRDKSGEVPASIVYVHKMKE